MKRTAQAGFTLVELAIVIAIIGLVAGGIMGGQAFIRSSRVSSVVVDAKTYESAIGQFKQQYGYLPGDFPTATQVWGRADGGVPITANCATPDTTASAGKTTCNGNGNGEVEKWAPIEHWRAWQHLAAAGLISGVYTGVAGSGGVDHVLPGVNVPRGPLDNTGYWLHNWRNEAATDPTNFPAGNPADYGLVFVFGGALPNSVNFGDALTGDEAWGIDNKVDDGRPGSGKVRNAPYQSSPCYTGSAAAPNAYNRTSAGKCVLLFLLPNVTSML